MTAKRLFTDETSQIGGGTISNFIGKLCSDGLMWECEIGALLKLYEVKE